MLRTDHVMDTSMINTYKQQSQKHIIVYVRAQQCMMETTTINKNNQQIQKHCHNAQAV